MLIKVKVFPNSKKEGIVKKSEDSFEEAKEKPLGDKFYQILKNNLLGEGKELFKDYWGNKYCNN